MSEWEKEKYVHDFICENVRYDKLKKAYSHEKAIQMILNGECGAFNPILLECLLDIQDRIKRKVKGSTQENNPLKKKEKSAELKEFENAKEDFMDSVFKNKHKLVHNQSPVSNRHCPFLLNLHQSEVYHFLHSIIRRE